MKYGVYEIKEKIVLVPNTDYYARPGTAVKIT